MCSQLEEANQEEWPTIGENEDMQEWVDSQEAPDYAEAGAQESQFWQTVYETKLK